MDIADIERIETWSKIEKFTGKTRKTLRKYVKDYGMPIMRSPGGWPVLYTWLYYEWEIRANELINKKKK